MLPHNRLRSALLELKQQQGGTISPDVREVAKHLIRERLLTRWHCEKLIAGKSRGFYLNRYKLLDHICTGGMSSVYLAEDTGEGGLRAVKVFPKSRIGQSSYLARFHREAEATEALRHPNIVQAFGLERQGDIYYLVMEYVRGRDLQVLVEEDGPLDYQEAANYMSQAATGLQYAHGTGLIHRDVKPANLLVNEHEVVKILDLGLALYTNQAASLTLAHNESVLGTADYLAPEQASDSHNVDARADIYGLGCTLYFALTGRPPFPEGTVAERIRMHQSAMPAPLTVQREDCPKELDHICCKMLKKTPEQRFQSCSEVALTLKNWMNRDQRLPVSVSSGKAEHHDDESRPAVASAARRAGRRNRPTARRKDDTLSARKDETIVSRKSDVSSEDDNQSSLRERFVAAPYALQAAKPRSNRRIALWVTAGLLAVGVLGGIGALLLG